MEKEESSIKNQKQTSEEVEEKENGNKEKSLSPEEKIKDLEDKLSRALAEMENQRRRYEKEKDDAFDYGGFTFAKETLNLIDNLERSKVTLQNDSSLKDTDALKKILEHLEIINKDTMSIFKKNSIESIDSIDKKLDPNFHQAMMEVEDDEKEPGTIVQEIQKGFMMKDRLLRPALVAVSKTTESNKQKSEKDEQNQDKSKKKK
tara:strand:- start:646 stop:1257 length:612 start_codon:yes stop_codon:yes gene_type:complete